MAWVTQPGVQVDFHFIDHNGARAISTMWMNDSETDPESGGPAAVAAAYQAISNDFLSSVEVKVRAIWDATPVPTDGPYARGADKAMFVLRAADGSEPKLQLGAPNETIFKPDALNIDPADAAVIGLVGALVTYGKTAEGQAITGLQMGYRRRPANRKGL